MKGLFAMLAVLLLLSGCALSGQETNSTTLPTMQRILPTKQPTIPTETIWMTDPTITVVTEPTVTEPTVTEPVVTEPAVTDPAPSVLSGICDMKAIWLSQFDLYPTYTDNGKQREQATYVSRMSAVLDNVCKLGFNTVIVQVRPNGDSMYPSEYYPMSKYVVGSYGKEASYDPVEILVELAKQRGLSVHAWINPLRLMTTAELEAVDPAYQIRQWYDSDLHRGTYIVQSGLYWYLNPAYDAVRQLIVCGAAELLDAYDFDGLHMDDYFYPTTDAGFDSVAYAEFGAGRSLDQFRRDSLNALVAALYDATKTAGEEKLYGISPAGNIKNAYALQYADVYTWCSTSGYVDYICPQVYFGLEHQTHDFVSVCHTWQDIITAEHVDLVIGMTFDKAMTLTDQYAGSGKNEWKDHKDIMMRCLQYTVQLEKCRGISVFSYLHFFDPSTGEEVAATAEERSNFIPVLKDISWRGENNR